MTSITPDERDRSVSIGPRERTRFTSPCALAALVVVMGCGSPSEPDYFIRLNTDRITVFEGRFVDVSATVRLPGANLEAGLLSWHLSGITRSAEGSIVIQYLNDIHTVVRVWGYATDSGYLVATQGASPPMDSAIIVVRPVRVASLRLDPDTLRVAIDEQGTVYSMLSDSSGTALVRASLDWGVSDTSIATVEAQSRGGASGSGVGLVRGKRAGTTTVFATVEGLTDSAVVIVRTP